MTETGDWTLIDRERQACAENIDGTECDLLRSLLAEAGHGVEIIKPDGSREVRSE